MVIDCHRDSDRMSVNMLTAQNTRLETMLKAACKALDDAVTLLSVPEHAWAQHETDKYNDVLNAYRELEGMMRVRD